MSEGMRIWGADGALQMDENSFSVRVVLSTVVYRANFTGQGVQTFSIPGITTANSASFLVPIDGSYSTTTTQFETEVVNDAVNVYNYIRGWGTYSLTSTVPSMRLVVVRFS